MQLARAHQAVSGRLAARTTQRRAEAEGTATAPRSAFAPLVKRLARDCHSVLDVGTGLMRSLEDLPCPVKIGLDAHRPYLEHREVVDAVPINASALELERLFVPGAADLVTFIDVIEHFPPDEAREVLRQAEQVARRRVLLFTPRGHFPQEGHDAFGLGGEELQRHRSSWEPEDFLERGYRVAVFAGFHGPWNESFREAFGGEAAPIDALLAWRDLSA
jgi:hypothetical protein